MSIRRYIEIVEAAADKIVEGKTFQHDSVTYHDLDAWSEIAGMGSVRFWAYLPTRRIFAFDSWDFEYDQPSEHVWFTHTPVAASLGLPAGVESNDPSIGPEWIGGTMGFDSDNHIQFSCRDTRTAASFLRWVLETLPLRGARIDFFGTHPCVELDGKQVEMFARNGVIPRGARLIENATAPRYRFVTTCVDTYLNGPHGEAIHDMKQARHGIIDFDDIMRLIGPAELERAGLDPTTLEDDFAVSWEQSVWRGIPCIYIVQSGIEHIFTPDGQTPGPWVDDDDLTESARRIGPKMTDDAKASAQAAGFDTSKVWYHGTDRRFTAFRNRGERGNYGELGYGIYLTGNADVANSWARTGNYVLACFLREKPIFDLARKDDPAVIRDMHERHTRMMAARWGDDQGYDVKMFAEWYANLWRRTDRNESLHKLGFMGAVDHRSQIADQIVIFDPADIFIAARLPGW